MRSSAADTAIKFLVSLCDARGHRDLTGHNELLCFSHHCAKRIVPYEGFRATLHSLVSSGMSTRRAIPSILVRVKHISKCFALSVRDTRGIFLLSTLDIELLCGTISV